MAFAINVVAGRRKANFGLSGLLLIFISLAGNVFSQTPQPTATPTPEIDPKSISVKTDLITLTLTVTDTYGRYVSGLTKNAFTVMDNGKEQEITFFSDSDAPASVGILFDISG